MSTFNVELRRVVDDSYEIEIGYELEHKLIDDLKAGLIGTIKKFVVVTDSIVKDLYANRIHELLLQNDYESDLIYFPAGEKSKNGKQKSLLKILCWQRVTEEIAVLLLSAEVL